MATTAGAPVVDTGKVTGRRKVRFDKIDDILADVDMLSSRGYRQLGNWPLGQMCKHLSIAMSMPVDGSEIEVAWFIRFVARTFVKPRMLRDGMKPGFKLNPKAAKVLVPDVTGDPEGIAALRAMAKRFQSEPLAHPHPFFGPLTPEEWKFVQLRHAEMHLGFLLPN